MLQSCRYCNITIFCCKYCNYTIFGPQKYNNIISCYKYSNNIIWMRQSKKSSTIFVYAFCISSQYLHCNSITICFRHCNSIICFRYYNILSVIRSDSWIQVMLVKALASLSCHLIFTNNKYDKGLHSFVKLQEHVERVSSRSHEKG